jgi:hypothetical protein
MLCTAKALVTTSKLDLDDVRLTGGGGVEGAADGPAGATSGDPCHPSRRKLIASNVGRSAGEAAPQPGWSP